jgi:nuclear pore complex protein Nup53
VSPQFLFHIIRQANFCFVFAANSPTASPASMQQKFLTGLQSPNPLFNSSMNQSFNQFQQGNYHAQTPQSNNANNGPPINSLFDNLRNESFQTPTKSIYNQSQIVHHDTPHLNASGFNQSRLLSPIPLSYAAAAPTTNEFNSSYHKQNIIFNNSQSMNGLNQQRLNWVTVFGFPSEALTIVLSHFSGCGTIMEKVCSSGNWMHIRYSSRAESDKSLLYNGKIIGNNLMIGVVRCEDESIIDKENVVEYSQASVSKIRSLTQAAYRSARNETEVVPSGDEPRKTSGIVNKAMDMLFGW